MLMLMLGLYGSGYRARCEALNERPSSFRGPFERQTRALGATSARERQARRTLLLTRSTAGRDSDAATAERAYMPV